MPSSDDPEATAREFGTLLAERELADAERLLADDDAVLESFPEEFAEPEMDAGDALQSYWYGLHGHYGDFEGVDDVIVEDRDATVELSFAAGTQRLDLTVDEAGGVAAVSLPAEYTPPEYADPETFEERAVTVDAGDVDLDGVLTTPDGDGPFPAMVLVHGHGATDPDATAGSTKILKDVAWGLATEGVATLRYEKRLHDHEVPDEAYTLDRIVVDDAVAALDELAAADAVDPDSVFVAGHSQGGMCAPRIADRHGGAAGVAVLDSLVDYDVDPDGEVEFMQYNIDPYGDLDEAQEAALDAQREALQRVADGDFDADDTVLGQPGGFWQSRLEFAPGETVENLDVPVFSASTERVDHDHQQPLLDMSREGYEEWQALDAADGSRFEYYEDVGHYFREGPVPSTTESLYFGGNVAGYVVADLADWVHEVADG
ncbi:alpha/beta hydrolase family protein [Halobacterium rubrum]|uniref:alpha/beta hydrolase family protein n=1 Tax=Halobacterium TaxID=2239 RepID=UPI001F186508|nr:MULTISPECIES: alpha/beta fold hydrolase [Halobacterium]MDH5019816.1 alpha/beta fold hydrolase [Halobacterium rubrum]